METRPTSGYSPAEKGHVERAIGILAGVPNQQMQGSLKGTGLSDACLLFLQYLLFDRRQKSLGIVERRKA
jgi:hypothetical protein